MTVNIVENFVSLDYANQIISGSDIFLTKSNDREGYFEDTNVRLAISKNEYDLNKDSRAQNDRQVLADMLMSDSLYITKKYLENFYGVELTKYEGGLVKTVEGAHNGMHSDMYQLDGSPWNDGTGREDQLEYSALLYLSEYEKDFLGGQILFLKQNLLISPKPGMLVFFRGDLDHVHEVTRVESGARYAMIMFFGK